jgi:hypothetical protein
MYNDSERIIRWGIIGLGRTAHKFAQDLKEVPDVELYAEKKNANSGSDKG